MGISDTRSPLLRFGHTGHHIRRRGAHGGALEGFFCFNFLFRGPSVVVIYCQESVGCQLACELCAVSLGHLPGATDPVCLIIAVIRAVMSQ